jgi:integrase
MRHQCGAGEKMKVNFTKPFLKNCTHPLKGNIYFQDTPEKGLSVYITSKGVISFVVRKRVSGKDEMPRFFKALAEEENHAARDYILMSLLTGARKSNVLAMRWEEVNFSLKEWHIQETKKVRLM